MTRIVPCRILMVLALAVPLAGVPTAAHARSWGHRDARGDVLLISKIFEEVNAAPNRAHGDIIGNGFRHTDTRVQIRVRFAELRRSTLRDSPMSTLVRIETNEGVKRMVSVAASPGHWAGTATMYRLFDYNYTVRCRIYRSFDYVHNVVTVGFPRACVSRPRWVRISVENHNASERPSDEAGYYDDGLANATYVPTDDDLDAYIVPPVFSPRIYRG